MESSRNLTHGPQSKTEMVSVLLHEEQSLLARSISASSGTMMAGRSGVFSLSARSHQQGAILAANTLFGSMEAATFASSRCSEGILEFFDCLRLFLIAH